MSRHRRPPSNPTWRCRAGEPPAGVDEPTSEPVRELDDVELEEQLAAVEDAQRAAQARDVDADRTVASELAEEADRAPSLAELDAARESVDDPQLTADAVADQVAEREPPAAEATVEPDVVAVAQASRQRGVDEPTAEPVRELDDVELEQQLAAVEDAQRAAQARDVDADRTVVPEPAVEADRAPEPADLERADVELADAQWAAAERDRVEPAQGDVEQLVLLDIEPRIADEVGAAPLRAPDPAEQQAEREQQDERTRATLAEARRTAEAAEQQRRTRDAVAQARAAVQALMAAEAERVRLDEDERREQLNRWYEQDRAAEQERGLDAGWDDSPSIDY